jgi:hypothetical protein
MVHLSLGQAAKEASVSKATISKALSSGRLSYVSKSSSGYQIDPAELFRVFPPKPLPTVASERSETTVETAKSDSDRVELQLLRERVEELQRDRDAWREQAQRLALAGPEQQPRKGWSLFGRR